LCIGSNSQNDQIFKKVRRYETNRMYQESFGEERKTGQRGEVHCKLTGERIRSARRKVSDHYIKVAFHSKILRKKRGRPHGGGGEGSLVERAQEKNPESEGAVKRGADGLVLPRVLERDGRKNKKKRGGVKNWSVPPTFKTEKGALEPASLKERLVGTYSTHSKRRDRRREKGWCSGGRGEKGEMFT